MKRVAIRTLRDHSHLWPVLKLISGLVAGALILMVAAGGAAAEGKNMAPVAGETRAGEAPESAETGNDGVESVTMGIDLEEGGVIDLDVPGSEVRVDTWKGDEILLIVEKRSGSRFLEKRLPVNIEVSRRGRDVRIAAAGVSARRMDALGVSFRILVPETERGAIRWRETRYSNKMAKLTSVLLRALSREALNWIAH